MDTGGGHGYGAFLNGSYEIIAPNPNYNPRLDSIPSDYDYERSEIDEFGKPYDEKHYIGTGKYASSINSILDGWMKDKSISDVMVCHSQGCNIAMNLINRGCTAK